VRRLSVFHLILHFFGLTQEYRLYIFSQIHDIVFHGNGGYDWNTIYNMPIWLRKYTFHKIKEYYDREKEEMEKAQGKNRQSAEIARPNVANPTYSTKAAKK
jgi:hypothetical protein